jgi:hypothetical protein
MLLASYLVAALAMGGSAAYLIYRLRLFFTATTMLLGSLLLIYGPAYLSFVLSSGEKSMVLHRLAGSAGGRSEIFRTIQSASPDFGAILTAMNLAIALMFVGVIVGIAIVDRLASKSAAGVEAAVAAWNAQPLRDGLGSVRALLIVIVGLTLTMAFVSIREDHLGTIRAFLSISDDAVRQAFRIEHGGSPNYWYRVILGAIAPIFVIWGLLSGWLNRSWPLLLASGLLFVAVMTGKFEVLSKAPAALFLIQLAVAGLLVFRNTMSGRAALVALLAAVLVFYAAIKLTMASYDQFGAMGFLFYRAFEVPSESLLETFGAFPFRFPHTMGANIRGLAALMGVDFIPSYSVVSRLWHGSDGLSSNALFIADAWIAFSYIGVLLFSILAGVLCRAIDAFFLVEGKTIVSVSVLAATSFGIFTLLISALNTAAITGGLLLAPVTAGLVVKAVRFFKRSRRSQRAVSGP